MALNCKPGDLAVMVRSAAENDGKLFTVLSWVGYYQFRGGGAADDCWECRCEQRVVGKFGQVTEAGDTRVVRDSQLRPIRDPGEDAKDETLLWLPVPEKEKA